jgi:hypothetical protein
MQNQVEKVMVPKQLEPQKRKAILHVFIWEIYANMTQVSDLASGLLFSLTVHFISGSDLKTVR